MESRPSRIVSSDDDSSASLSLGSPKSNLEHSCPLETEDANLKFQQYKLEVEAQQLQAGQVPPPQDFTPIKKRKQKQSMYKMQRQYSREAHTKFERGSFYWDKMERIKRGQPVGRFSRREKKVIERQQHLEKQANKQRKILNKKADAEFERNFNKESPEEFQKREIKMEYARKERYVLSVEQSERLINLFSRNEGDYIELEKQMPEIPKEKIRSHLKFLFERNLDIIVSEVQSKCNISIEDWKQEERAEIIRELHRIRATNRLLSQSNIEFRENFHLLMHSYNQPSIVFQAGQIYKMYRKIDSFVRGFSTRNPSNHQKELKIEGRSTVLQGGHIFNDQYEAVLLKKGQSDQPKSEKIHEDDIIRSVVSWTKYQNQFLQELFKDNTQGYDQNLIQASLAKQFGNSPRWNRPQFLNGKINELARKGLCKLYDLTQDSHFKKQESAEGYIGMIGEADSLYREDRKCQLQIFSNVIELETKLLGPVALCKLKPRKVLIDLLNNPSPTCEQLLSASRSIRIFLNFSRLQDLKKSLSFVKAHQDGRIKKQECEIKFKSESLGVDDQKEGEGFHLKKDAVNQNIYEESENDEDI